MGDTISSATCTGLRHASTRDFSTDQGGPPETPHPLHHRPTCAAPRSVWQRTWSEPGARATNSHPSWSEARTSTLSAHGPWPRCDARLTSHLQRCHAGLPRHFHVCRGWAHVAGDDLMGVSTHGQPLCCCQSLHWWLQGLLGRECDSLPALRTVMLRTAMRVPCITMSNSLCVHADTLL